MAILPDDSGSGWGASTPTASPSSSGPIIKSIGGRDFQWVDDGYGGGTWEPLGLTPNSGGGGGSSSVDHFYDISPIDQYNMDRNAANDARQAANDDRNYNLKVAEDARQAAIDDRNLALQQGNLDLAKQKQADANHWQEVSNQIQREQIAQQAAGQQLQYQASMAGIAQQKEDSDKRFQVGMAGSTNDRQRNEIEAQWNAEQAQIAKMEDETKRVLGGQANQTAQFGAETDRAARMGNLALENNKFIEQMATSPRDLPSLFFMQRGIAPDWQTIINGGTPATGAALAPADVMHAYVPTTAPVQFNGTPANSQAAGVGAAAARGVAASQQANPFIVSAGGSPAQAQPRPAPAGMMSAPPPQQTQYGNDNVVQQVPAQPAPQRPDIFRYYTPGMAMDNSQAYARDIATDYRAGGGFTTARHIVAGDAPAPNPAAGGALPEGIENPLGAPLFIHRNPRTAQLMALYGASRHALGTDNSGAYAAQGMGSAWIGASNNDYANNGNTPLPPALKALADYGYPISPSIYSSATGNIAPTLNVADAYRQRGGGTLFGLQTLNNMTPGEQEAQRGISEGVVGVPWNDLVDYISRGTAGLKTAQQARAA